MKSTNPVLLQRILTGLRYYSSLDVRSNANDAKVFSNFVNKIYGSRIVDDFHHINDKHGHEIYNILEYACNNYKFTKCDVNRCNFASRQFRTNDESAELNVDDAVMSVYIDLLDSIHFHILHIFDTGFRFIKQSGDSDDDDDDLKQAD